MSRTAASERPSPLHGPVAEVDGFWASSVLSSSSDSLSSTSLHHLCLPLSTLTSGAGDGEPEELLGVLLTEAFEGGDGAPEGVEEAGGDDERHPPRPHHPEQRLDLLAQPAPAPAPLPRLRHPLQREQRKHNVVFGDLSLKSEIP